MPTEPRTLNPEPWTPNPEPSLFGLPYEIQRSCRDEIARMSKQVRSIYDALLSGPRTNVELARISLKYTGRISDLRKQIRPRGFDVECVQDRKTGVSHYRLVRTSPSGATLAGRPVGTVTIPGGFSFS